MDRIQVDGHGSGPGRRDRIARAVVAAGDGDPRSCCSQDADDYWIADRFSESARAFLPLQIGELLRALRMRLQDSVCGDLAGDSGAIEPIGNLHLGVLGETEDQVPGK